MIEARIKEVSRTGKKWQVTVRDKYFGKFSSKSFSYKRWVDAQSYLIDVMRDISNRVKKIAE